ncbi:MAG TPA: zinc ribbon domain-containing protein [Solirubrobacteraceae bacterium]|jgi:hypothetical protein|nr:zinc ribbon domain-containing protein [Solirubrobacteraceae bacterium]
MVERDSAQAGAGEHNGAVSATGFMQRAVVRRRLRFLRRRRELLLHDLGGFVFESHRLGEDRDELRSEKLEALSALDAELAVLEHALGAHEEVAVLREPGIASCPRCSTIHDSAANFCPNCGRSTDEPRTADTDALSEDGHGAGPGEVPIAADPGEVPAGADPVQVPIQADQGEVPDPADAGEVTAAADPGEVPAAADP